VTDDTEREEQTDAHFTIELLARAVQLATGNDDAGPREGQAAFTKNVANAMTLGGEGEVVGIMPTGTGKSFAALSTAAARAVRHRERSVISTESLSLQAQYAEKDAPTMQAAVLDLTGYELDVAVMKGFSNYVCGQRAAMSAKAALSLDSAPVTAKQLRDAAERLFKGEGTPAPLMEELGADGDTVLPLVEWALGQHFGPETEEVGDRFSYEGKMTGRDWNAVSISSADCIGKECPLRDVCKVVKSREHARNADIVITNHSILAVQAANNIPVLIGNPNLKRESDEEGFKHLIVDEAHTLPGQVRAQGSNELSGGKVISAARAVSRVIDDAAWVKRGEQLAELVEQQISQLSGGKDERKLVVEDDPMLAPLAGAAKAWAKEGTSFLKIATTSSVPEVRIRANRANNALTMLVAAAENIAEYKAGVARWIERPSYGGPKRGAQWHVAHASPVDVSNAIKNSLWNTPVRPDKDGVFPDADPITGIVMSATLPSRFGMQVGMEVQEKDYPSPFDTAYGSSVLYIPRADNPVDIGELGAPNRWSGKTTFDTKKHALWAAEHIVELCQANGGAALVIGATGDNARLYADMLRMKTNLRVLSQWDGEGLRQLMDEWREDENSVLVGTRSLMTGVDAPGQTCSLVILDRPPRSAGNPVDDARVDALTQRLGDKWAADRYVYVADATALTEQAAGRLIRSVSDHGMFALLDPRLLKVGTYKYPAPTRDLYMKSVRRFDNKMAGKEESRAWLRAQQASRMTDNSDAL
jgi:ATP-dependent DNA helicase DinG